MSVDFENLQSLISTATAKDSSLQPISDAIAQLAENYTQLQEDLKDCKIIQKVLAKHGSQLENNLYFSLKEKIASLEAANSEIAMLNESLIHRVEEQALELVKSREEAERLAQLAAHTEFTMAIAHELKNPLAGLISHAEAFEPEDAAEPTIIIQIMDTIRRNALRMKQILSTMIKYGDTNSSESAVVDLTPILGDIHQLVQPICTHQRIELSLTISDDIRVIGDPTALYRAILNIGMNAISSMPTGGQLTLSSSTDGGFGTIAISDTGTGIPEDEQHRIYDLFYSRSKEEGHLGMGLSMALQIVKNHGGELTFKSVVNHGTTFFIRLPRVQS